MKYNVKKENRWLVGSEDSIKSPTDCVLVIKLWVCKISSLFLLHLMVIIWCFLYAFLADEKFVMVKLCHMLVRQGFMLVQHSYLVIQQDFLEYKAGMVVLNDHIVVLKAYMMDAQNYLVIQYDYLEVSARSNFGFALLNGCLVIVWFSKIFFSIQQDH